MESLSFTKSSPKHGEDIDIFDCVYKLKITKTKIILKIF